MKLAVLTESIVLKKQGLEVSLVQISSIEKHILTVFEDAKPIINKFPDFLAITLGAEQFQIVFQANTISLNSDYGDNASHRKELITLARKIDSELAEFPLEAYGLNFKVFIEEFDPTSLHSFVKFDELNTKGVFQSSNLAIPVISFLEKIENGPNLRQYTLSFAPNRSADYSGTGEAMTNLHNVAQELPDFESLSKALKDESEHMENSLELFLK